MDDLRQSMDNFLKGIKKRVNIAASIVHNCHRAQPCGGRSEHLVVGGRHVPDAGPWFLLAKDCDPLAWVRDGWQTHPL